MTSSLCFEDSNIEDDTQDCLYFRFSRNINIASSSSLRLNCNVVFGNLDNPDTGDDSVDEEASENVHDSDEVDDGHSDSVRLVRTSERCRKLHRR